MEDTIASRRLENPFEATVLYKSQELGEFEQVRYDRTVETTPEGSIEEIAPDSPDIDLANEFDDLSISWNQVLKFLDQENLEEAYKLILEMDDDLYLIRLMIKTGACYEKLSSDTGEQLRNKVRLVSRARCLQDLYEQFLSEEKEVELDMPSIDRTWNAGLEVDSVINNLERKICY